MVKTLEFKGYFDFASPELVFKTLYEDDSFTKLYHKEVNQDPNASATAWIEKDGASHRVVTFRPHISNVPVILQRFIGNEIAPLTELQQYTKVGSTITIHSDLSAALFMGVTLVSTGDTILSPAGEGCEIVVKLTIELQTILPFTQDKMENEVEKEAENSFKRWLSKAKVFCERSIKKEAEPSLEREDSFHDAEELGEEEELSLVELNTDFTYGPPSSSSLRCSGRLQFLQIAWSFCFSMWNQIEQKSSFLRHSTFFVNPWTTMGLGILAGLTLGLLYNRHLKKSFRIL